MHVWQNEIRKKILEQFINKPEVLARVLFFLDEEDKEYHEPQDSPVWRILKESVKLSSYAFELYAERLANDTKEVAKDQRFRQVIRDMYEEMLSATDDCTNDGKGLRAIRPTLFAGMAIVWEMVGAKGQEELLSVISKIVDVVGTKEIMSIADKFVGLATTRFGAELIIREPIAFLAVDATRNIYRWWIGEISGKRCAKSVLDSLGSVSGGMVLGAAGAALGLYVRPGGTVLVRVAGSFVGNIGGGILARYITQQIFGIPEDEALENAYNFLGLESDAENNEINYAFRRLCLKHHPDRPKGNADKFIKLQVNLQIIKTSRGEIYQNMVDGLHSN